MSRLWRLDDRLTFVSDGEPKSGGQGCLPFMEVTLVGVSEGNPRGWSFYNLVKLAHLSLKGWDNSAQGNALGLNCPKKFGPERGVYRLPSPNAGYHGDRLCLNHWHRSWYI
jgi:hypothetical protein